MNNNIDLNLLRTFAKVVELKGFTKAAQALKQPKSRVSQAVKRLEKHVGFLLLRRHTRAMSLTNEGRELYRRTQQLIKNLESELNHLHWQNDRLEGTLRLSAPEDIGHCILAKIIAHFQNTYPQVNFDVLLSNDFVDLAENGLDLVFRIGKLENSNLIQKKIANVKLILVASAEYFQDKKLPHHLEELGHHRLLSFVKLEEPIPFNPLEDICAKPLSHQRIYCNSFALLNEWMRQKQGIALLPDFYVNHDIHNGKLIHVLPELNVGQRPLHLIYLSSKNMPLRLRKFIDFAYEEMTNYFNQNK